MTRAGEYTFGIEGPAVDPAGNLYVVNFQKAGTIGKLKPGAVASEFFAALPEGSIGNSIRFALDGRMFIADYKIIAVDSLPSHAGGKVKQQQLAANRYPARVRWRTTISRTPTSSRRSLSAVLYWISARSRVGIARSVIARSRPDVRRADVLARLDSRTG